MGDPPHNEVRAYGSVRLWCYSTKHLHMFTILSWAMDRLDRFECWFDKHFGWFFTNGMKGGRAASGSPFRA